MKHNMLKDIPDNFIEEHINNCINATKLLNDKFNMNIKLKFKKGINYVRRNKIKRCYPRRNGYSDGFTSR